MRVLVGLGIAVLVCGTYLWFFGVQTAFSLEARYIARKMPVVKKAPVKLPDLSISQASGKKLSYFGYEFEIPWDDIDEAKSRTIGGNRAIIAFRSGNVLSVWSGSPREFVNTVLSSGKIDPDAFRQIYGDEALQSDYAFHRIMLETTPDKITPFISTRQAVSGAMLLLMKGISAPRGADSGVFVVRAGEFTGFQYGRPLNPPGGLSVELFADSGSLDFIFGQKVNGSTVISQPDINRILQTLHKAPTEAVANARFVKAKRGYVTPRFVSPD
jgi:hypothetical protein